MSSGCISTSAVGCVDTRIPVRPTYRNIYKWPESDAEFARSVSSAATSTTANNNHHHHRRRRHHHHYQQQHRQHPRVVDAYSCRQMYLRSYTFSRKETVPEKTRKCLGKAKEKVAGVVHMGRNSGGGGGGEERVRRYSSGVRRLKDVSCSAVYAIFRRLLSCTASVDVVDDHRVI